MRSVTLGRSGLLLPALLAAALAGTLAGMPVGTLAAADLQRDLQRIGTQRGIVGLVELPDRDPTYPVQLARASELLVFLQTSDEMLARDAQRAAADAGLLNERVFVFRSASGTLPLADNVADCLLVAGNAASATGTAGPRGTAGPTESELLRVLRPRGTAWLPDRQLVKPVPSGIDEWTHPYHGPDNNPQSRDQLVRGALRTQFIGYPKFSPMPEQSVVAGGRIYKALGHIAHKANQNEMLNTLLCINAYNGTLLWKRPLPEGFMIHRNTMVATDDALYLGDHESCKVFDGATGQLREQLTFPREIADGPVWKWMALRDGVLYALVGNPEIQVETQKSQRRGLGHWPWGMWKGHDYADPRTAFGHGRTLIALDLKSRKLLWHYRDDEFLDARAVCMNDRAIYCFCPEKFLLSIDPQDGKPLWRNTTPELLAAIGPNEKAQHYVTGYATTCYIKCSNDYLFFAGPQRKQLVVASAADGRLAWTFPTGNLQLVLRDDALWAAGPQRTQGVRLDYATGRVLDEFPARRACTRATGCADSIFYRASGGTVRVLTETNQAQHIAPMRPPCQDGVIVSNGHLYWGPWMCGCQLSLYGNIALAPVGESGLPTDPETLYADALRQSRQLESLQPLEIRPHDWPSYRGSNRRDDVTSGDLPPSVQLAWETRLEGGGMPTAPVAAGGLVFCATRGGTIQAFDTRGKPVWRAQAGGAIYYPPALAEGRLFVGASDGYVTAYEARTGRWLWSFRVAPRDRWIPVFGKLVSTWPVAGGVVVREGTVYTAAGIAHYDGTYVVALDAASGQLKTANVSSGTLSPEVNNGISLQGNLAIVDDVLQFLGGGVYETARYELGTLKCLNQPLVQVNSQFRTAFYPYYPEYNQYVSLEHKCENGCTLTHDASYEGSEFTNLALYEPLPPGVNLPPKEAARWLVRRGQNPPKIVWQDRSDRRFNAVIVSRQALLSAGHPDAEPDQHSLLLTRLRDGADLWRQPLPTAAVKGGLAIDADQRVYVVLRDGRLLCFQPN